MVVLRQKAEVAGPCVGFQSLLRAYRQTLLVSRVNSSQGSTEMLVWAQPACNARVKDTWQSTVDKDLSALHVQYNWFRLVHDRTGWDC